MPDISNYQTYVKHTHALSCIVSFSAAKIIFISRSRSLSSSLQAEGCVREVTVRVGPAVNLPQSLSMYQFQRKCELPDVNSHLQRSNCAKCIKREKNLNADQLRIFSEIYEGGIKIRHRILLQFMRWRKVL